jgi:hypothetical protein
MAKHMGNKSVADDELLARVATEVPEALNVEAPAESFGLIIRQLVHAKPAAKQTKKSKPKSRKRPTSDRAK